MKKQILFLIFSSYLSFSGFSQTTPDTVSTGANYTNQVWYNLENGTETSVGGQAWDLGFQINGFSAAILANTAYGAELFIYPNGDTSAWLTVDTAGINNWTSWHNPASTWNQGAFNQGLDTSNAVDLGWGTYNFINHHITGDSIFVWKTASGAIKKLWIEKLASGTYTFKIADLNGSNLSTKSLTKSNFTGKNFGYYNIAQDSILDLEPLANTWDLVFSKYIEDLGIPYSVSGIRTNIGVETAQVYPVANTTTYDSASTQTYTYDQNIIGHDWKNFDFGCFCYLIEDSTVYFVKTDSSTYWKLVMKGFGGSSDGNFMFEKTKIVTTTGISKNQIKEVGNILIYPNPSSQHNISLVADLPVSIKTAQLNIVNLNGQIVKSEQLNIQGSFEAIPIQLENLNTGIYFVQLQHKQGMITTRLVLN